MEVRYKPLTLERQALRAGRGNMNLFVAFDTGDELTATSIVNVLREWFGSSVNITFSAEFAFGENWRRRLDKDMQKGDALLAVCTRRSLENRWIHFEAGAFHGRGKRVIPVTVGGLRPEELPEPLNAFQAPNLELASDLVRFAKEIANLAGLPNPPHAVHALDAIRAVPTTGVPQNEEDRMGTIWTSLGLESNARAKVVLASTSYPYRLAIDDFIVLYASPGWQGHQRRDVISCSTGPRMFHPNVARVASEHREARPDKDDNKPKLALVQIDPFLSDRDHLRLQFENMHYFDFEGPRRALFKGDAPTTFAQEFYLGREIPEEIPTPLACVHTILVTGDQKHLVLGLRRKAAKPDFYDNRLCVGFEEQMSPEDEDFIHTVKRGLKQEAGIQSLSDDRIELLAIGLEASFFSIALLAVAWLDCDAEALHRSIQFKATDHEWDALFVPNDKIFLRNLLATPLPEWSALTATHFLTFTPLPEYEWHGTSRVRLFAYLARKEGIGRVLRM